MTDEVRQDTQDEAQEPQEEVQEEATEATEATEAVEPEGQLTPAEERATGVKEQAVSDIGLAAATRSAGLEPEKPVFPSFFVETEKRHRIEVDILYDKASGNVLSISKVGLGVDFEQYPTLGHTVEWFEFTQPSYDDIATYRRNSQVFRREANRMVVDGIQMRNYFLVWHLKDWSLCGADGKKIELEHDSEGSLSDESLEKVYELSPTLVDVVLTIYERDVILT